MRGLFSKLSDQLKVRHILDCIAVDINYLNIYSHIYGWNRKQNRDMSTKKMQNLIFKVQRSLCLAKIKKQTCYIYVYTLSRNLCFNSWFKNRFQKAFVVKDLVVTKGHTYEKTSLLLLAAGLSKYVWPFLWPFFR